MSDPIRIRITNDPRALEFLRVKSLRLDIGEGEPQCLSSEVEIAPGDTVSIPLYPGATLIIDGKAS